MKLKSWRGSPALAVILAVIGVAAAHTNRTMQLIQPGGNNMAETSNQQNSQQAALQQTAKPNPDLKSLERLIGKWKVTGDAQGEISYEWMEGGFFMLQRFDLLHAGRRNKGIEIIGHLHPLFGEPSKDIRTRVYSQLDGLTLDYVYELEGNTLTIWGGEKGSPAYFKGTFSKDGNTLTGSWVYPGGGYSTTSTRVK